MFANISTAGRTGHEYPNMSDGNDLIWYGKTSSKLTQNSIQSLIDPTKMFLSLPAKTAQMPNLYILVTGNQKKTFDTSPVKIIWQFTNRDENHPEVLPQEVNESDHYVEGAVKQVYVNVFERNPIARKKCIEYHGCQCSVCGFNFEIYYGEIGVDFIHVHHLKALHEIGEEYEVDPMKDLPPVCPNCHAMLHKKTPAYTVDELRYIIQRNREANRLHSYQTGRCKEIYKKKTQ